MLRASIFCGAELVISPSGLRRRFSWRERCLLLNVPHRVHVENARELTPINPAFAADDIFDERGKCHVAIGGNIVYLIPELLLKTARDSVLAEPNLARHSQRDNRVYSSVGSTCHYLSPLG